MSYSTYGMLPSGVWIKRKIFSLLWWVFILVMGCAHEETVQIDETAQPAGKARLVRKGEVKLHITEGPRLGDIGGVFLTEDAFYINDVTVNRIFEYNLSGYFVRTIGRRGQGVGEYMRPHPDATVVDYAGNIYTYDSASAKLNKYDKTNQFIVDLNENIRLGYTDHLLLDSEGNLLQLIKSEDGIAILSYYEAPGRLDEMRSAAKRAGLRTVQEMLIPRAARFFAPVVLGYRDKSIWVYRRG